MGNNEISTQLWPKQVVIVTLPAEPQTNSELETAMQVVMNDSDFDVVIDFSEVDTISKQAICNLVILQRLLHTSSRHLGFSNIKPTLEEAFNTHRLSMVIASDWDGLIDLEPQEDQAGGGTLVFENQNRTKVYERRNYVRLNLSQSLKIPVELWPVSQAAGRAESAPTEAWRGVLIDISAGGAQVAVDFLQKATIRKGEFIRMRFAPIVYELSLTVDAVIRETLPTADTENICLGLQFVGLAANIEAQRVLERLCDSEKRYFATTLRSSPKELLWV